MGNKKSFVFYDSWGEVFDEMNDEEAGKMIKTMIIYHREKTVKNMPLSLRLAFALIKNQISERHARSLLNVKNKEIQLMFLNRIKNESIS